MAVDDDVGQQLAAVADLDVLADDAIRPDLDVTPDARAGMHDRGRVDVQRVDAGAVAAWSDHRAHMSRIAASSWNRRVSATTENISCAVHTTWPSTCDSACKQPYDLRSHSTRTSIMRRSPGSTGRRKRTLSTPARYGTDVVAAFGSRITVPPSCAIASMMKMPGMTGLFGKCPWKNGSLMVTFLKPAARLRGSSSVMRSSSSIG